MMSYRYQQGLEQVLSEYPKQWMNASFCIDDKDPNGNQRIFGVGTALLIQVSRSLLFITANHMVAQYRDSPSAFIGNNLETIDLAKLKFVQFQSQDLA
jgi:hypothetical protein